MRTRYCTPRIVAAAFNVPHVLTSDAAFDLRAIRMGGPTGAGRRRIEIADRMKSFVDSSDAPGIVTPVQRRGQPGHLEAVGWLDKDKQIPMKTDSIFEVIRRRRVNYLRPRRQSSVENHDCIAKAPFIPLLSPSSIEVMTSLHTGDIKAGHLSGTGFGLAWEVTKEPLGTLSLMSIGSFGPRRSVRDSRLDRPEEGPGGRVPHPTLQLHWQREGCVHGNGRSRGGRVRPVRNSCKPCASPSC